MWDVSVSEASRIRTRIAWFRTYLKYAAKALFGPPMRYQVVIRVSGDASDDAVVMALDTLKKAYQETK